MWKLQFETDQHCKRKELTVLNICALTKSCSKETEWKSNNLHWTSKCKSSASFSIHILQNFSQKNSKIQRMKNFQDTNKAFWFFNFFFLEDCMMIYSLGQCGKQKLCCLLAKILTFGLASFLNQYYSHTQIRRQQEHVGSWSHRQLMTLPAGMPLPVAPQFWFELITTSICLCWQAVHLIRHWLLVPFSPFPKQPGRVCASCLSCTASVKAVVWVRRSRFLPIFIPIDGS